MRREAERRRGDASQAGGWRGGAREGQRRRWGPRWSDAAPKRNDSQWGSASASDRQPSKTAIRSKSGRRAASATARPQRPASGLVVQAAEGLGLRDLQRALAVAVEREAGLGEARDVNGAVSNADLENMLDGSSGNVLDLSLLGAECADFGSFTLNVPVSTLAASDFIIG